MRRDWRAGEGGGHLKTDKPRMREGEREEGLVGIGKGEAKRKGGRARGVNKKGGMEGKEGTALRGEEGFGGAEGARGGARDKGRGSTEKGQ